MLVPDPASSVYLPATTDGRGDATAIATVGHVPATVGTVLFTQWLVLDGGSCMGGTVSNAHEITIE